jgi:hypothetical protein
MIPDAQTLDGIPWHAVEHLHGVVACGLLARGSRLEIKLAPEAILASMLQCTGL